MAPARESAAIRLLPGTWRVELAEGKRSQPISIIRYTILLELMLAVLTLLLLADRVVHRGLDTGSVVLGVLLMTWGWASTAATLQRPAGRILRVSQPSRPAPPR